MHRNQRVKESILTIICQLQDMYGSEALRACSRISSTTAAAAAVAAVSGSDSSGAGGTTSLCAVVATLVGDQQASVRQLAIDTLAKLHDTFGDELLVSLYLHLL